MGMFVGNYFTHFRWVGVENVRGGGDDVMVELLMLRELFEYSCSQPPLGSHIYKKSHILTFIAHW